MILLEPAYHKGQSLYEMNHHLFALHSHPLIHACLCIHKPLLQSFNLQVANVKTIQEIFRKVGKVPF
jgi:hypothetical protein